MTPETSTHKTEMLANNLSQFEQNSIYSYFCLYSVEFFFVLQQRHIWIANNITVLISLAPGISKNSNVEISFINVSLINSTWNISGLNLFLSNVNMSKTVISLTKGKTLNKILFAEISNSFFGQLNVDGNYKVNISEFNLDGSDGLGKTLINVKRCSLNLIDSNISNISTDVGPAIIKSVESRVIISNSKFRENIGTMGLIQILFGNLHLKNSFFGNNGIGTGYNISHRSLVSISFNSLGDLYNCTFEGNKGKNGSCMNCDPGSKLIVENSSFANNTGNFGGAIYCGVTDTTKENEEYCCYGNNTNVFKPKEHGKYRASCYFRNCTFVNNVAYEGKSLYIRSFDADIEDCSFVQTVPRYGGLVFGIEHGNISIHGTSFLSYTEKSPNASPILKMMQKFNPVVAVIVYGYCKLNISNSQFVGGSFMDVQNYSTAIIADSSFQGHDQMLYGLSFVNDVVGKFNNCILSNNSAVLILLRNNTVVTMETCKIVNNIFEIDGNVISLENKCQISLVSSNIGRNKVFKLSSIVTSSKRSAIFSKNCNYFNNSATNILSTSVGDTTVIGCNFFGNTLFDWWSVLINQHLGVIYVERSVFKQNKAGIGKFWNVSAMFKDSVIEQETPGYYHIYSYNSNVTVFNCSLLCKPVVSSMALMMTSDGGDGGDAVTYLAIKESHIRCTGLLTNQISHLVDVAIQNSRILFKGYKPTLNILGVQNVRIAYSEFYSDDETAVALGFNIGDEYRFSKTKFYTYSVKFRREEFISWSNNTQFFEDTKAQGLIKVRNKASATQAETPFASSKF